MEIGALRLRVDIQSPSATQDAAGQPGTGWTTLATVRADVRHQGGLEMLKAGADTSIVKASVRIRWRSDVTAAMRLLVGSTAYAIKAVLPDPRRRFMDLVCEVVS